MKKYLLNCHNPSSLKRKNLLKLEVFEIGPAEMFRRRVQELSRARVLQTRLCFQDRDGRRWCLAHQSQRSAVFRILMNSSSLKTKSLLSSRRWMSTKSCPSTFQLQDWEPCPLTSVPSSFRWSSLTHGIKTYWLLMRYWPHLGMTCITQESTMWKLLAINKFQAQQLFWSR